MKVKELIEELRNFEERIEARVFIDGYDRPIKKVFTNGMEVLIEYEE